MAERFGGRPSHVDDRHVLRSPPRSTPPGKADFDAVELRRTDFKRCFDTGMSNAQVLDLIKKSGIPVGVLGVEYGWLFATGDESDKI